MKNSTLFFVRVLGSMYLMLSLLVAPTAANASSDQLGDILRVINGDTEAGPLWRTMSMKDGSTYEGYVADQGLHGFGIYKFPDGDVYYGMFQDGVRSGFGIYFGGSQRNYYLQAGDWQEDQLNGNGSVHYRDHTIKHGTYQQGEAVGGTVTEYGPETVSSGYAEHLLLDNGTLYTGEYLLAGMEFAGGYGVLQCPDGSLYVGFFASDLPEESGFGFHVSADHTVTENSTWTSAESRWWEHTTLSTAPAPTPTPALTSTPTPPSTSACTNCGSDGLVACQLCKGTGKWYSDTCVLCHGSKTTKCDFCDGTGVIDLSVPICATCGGDGKITCQLCKGAGKWYGDDECILCYNTKTNRCSDCNGTGRGFSGPSGPGNASLPYESNTGAGFDWQNPTPKPVERCRVCSGRGTRECTLCWGSGGDYYFDNGLYHKDTYVWKDCARCHGSGEETCYRCHGDGIPDY